jgi:hypothetical protein
VIKIAPSRSDIEMIPNPILEAGRIDVCVLLNIQWNVNVSSVSVIEAYI